MQRRTVSLRVALAQSLPGGFLTVTPAAGFPPGA
jgi:hypothetical protein